MPAFETRRSVVLSTCCQCCPRRVLLLRVFVMDGLWRGAMHTLREVEREEGRCDVSCTPRAAHCSCTLPRIVVMSQKLFLGIDQK